MFKLWSFINLFQLPTNPTTCWKMMKMKIYSLNNKVMESKIESINTLWIEAELVAVRFKQGISNKNFHSIFPYRVCVSVSHHLHSWLQTDSLNLTKAFILRNGLNYSPIFSSLNKDSETNVISVSFVTYTSDFSDSTQLEHLICGFGDKVSESGSFEIMIINESGNKKWLCCNCVLVVNIWLVLVHHVLSSAIVQYKKNCLKMTRRLGLVLSSVPAPHYTNNCI